MKIKLNQLTGSERQIAYAQDLLQKAIRRESYLISDLEKEAEETLADSDFLDEVIASGRIGDMQKSDITLTFIVATTLTYCECDSPSQTRQLHNLGKAILETSAHAVIELLK